MIQIGFFRMASAVFCIVIFMSFSALAADPQPPFLGPPNMHANTVPGLLDVAGVEQQAYPEWRNGKTRIYFQSPWSACAQWGDDDFLVEPEMTGAVPGIYDKFKHWGRSFTFDQFDADGYPIGGTYDGGLGWPNDQGILILQKSGAGQATYNQVHLTGLKASGPVNVLLSLVEQNGYIGVANIASLGVIKPCGAADANSQIWLPLGKGANGQPTVIPDIDGDGVADPEFLTGPPVSGGAAPAPIPTLNEWGLIALTLILLILGLHFLRKNAHSTFA